MSEDKKIEIVSGNGKDLDISPVYDHLGPGKPDCNNKPKNVVIPKQKKENDDDNDNKKEKK